MPENSLSVTKGENNEINNYIDGWTGLISFWNELYEPGTAESSRSEAERHPGGNDQKQDDCSCVRRIIYRRNPVIRSHHGNGGEFCKLRFDGA